MAVSAKINSYILPKETKNEMLDIIGISIRSKLEHGFNLCVDKDNNIKPGKLCKGENLRVKRMRDPSEFFILITDR